MEKAVIQCDLTNRAIVTNKQFDEAADPGVSHIMCRAIDGFSKKMPRLIDWSKTADLMFFAGNNVRDALKKTKVEFSEKLIPMSDRRFLFHVKRDAEPEVNMLSETSPEAQTRLDQTDPREL